MEKYGLHGKLTAKEGEVQLLTEILLQASALVSTAKGCHVYSISRDPSDEHSVWITEIWDSKEDHGNSLKVPGVRELIAKAIPILEGNPALGQELVVLGGHF